MCVCVCVWGGVHPALVRYTKRSRTEALFVRWQKNGLSESRSQPQRGGPDRSRPEPDISEMARNSNRKSTRQRKSGQEDRTKGDIGSRKAEAGAAAGKKGKVSASVPVPERNRNRLSPQLRCQTRFRCELAKQTQSKLGIVHPALVRYTKRSRTEALFVRWQKNGLSESRSQPQRGGPDRSRPEPDISEMARNSKDSSSFSLTTAVGRANERNQGGRLEPDARSPSKGEGSGNKRS